jgi:hypothetical protein
MHFILAESSPVCCMRPKNAESLALFRNGNGHSADDAMLNQERGAAKPGFRL